MEDICAFPGVTDPGVSEENKMTSGSLLERRDLSFECQKRRSFFSAEYW